MMKRFKAIRELPDLYFWVSAVTLVLVGFGLIYHATGKVVTLFADGRVIELRTHSGTVDAALKASGFDVSPEDRISPSGDTPLDKTDKIYFESATAVFVELEGEYRTIRTTERTPANILLEAGIRLFPGDRIWADGIPIADPTQISEQRATRLRLVRAIPVTLKLDGQIQLFRSAAPTVGEALWETGVVLQEADRLIPSPETALSAAMIVELERAQEVVIEADGRTLVTRSTGPTVGEAIADAGVTLIGLDYTRPAVGKPIPSDGEIRVIRVREETLVELQPLPFGTVYQPAPDLEIDSLEVIDPGKYGVLANRIRIRMEDGEEISRIVEEAWEAVEPSPRIVGYGTKIVVRTLNTPDGRIEYWRAVPVYETSYSPCNSGVDWCSTLTTSGKTVSHGMIGVIRSWYNSMKGWPVYVPNYGVATIEDIGAGIAGRHWIDLAYTDETYERRHAWTTLYFLTPVPPLEYITWILP